MELPRFKHNSCGECRYLGEYNEYDLYYCPQGGLPTVIARWSDDSASYLSGMNVDHPALNEARARYEDA